MNWEETTWLYVLSLPAVLAIGLIAERLFRRAGGSVRWPGIKRVLASATGLKPMPARSARRRPWLLLLATATAIVALARPQWGEIEEPVFEHAREVMIALDLSRSMAVEDIPPSRLERARLLVQSLLGELHEERVGLIAFAGTAFVQVPMSSDYQILNEFLPEMDTDYMPQGGTDYAGMLKAALDGFSRKADTDRFLIVLSDGESQTGDWRAHLSELRENNIHVLTLGVGTPSGGFIPDGESGYKKDDRGAVVLSKLEPATLQALAAETGGEYRDASAWVDLNSLLQDTIKRGREGSFKEERSVRHVDRFQWFLGPALFLGLLGLWREISVRPQIKKIRQAGAASTSQTTRKKAATTVAAFALLSGLWAAMQSDAEAAETTPKPDPAAPVREVVTRISSLPHPDAKDWLELAEKTLAFGEELKTAQQQVPPGPVQDAIEGARLGRSSDASLADWAKLISSLENLLEPPPEQQKKEEQQNDQQDQQNQDNQQQPSGGENQNQEDQQQEDSEKPSQDENGQSSQEENRSEGDGPKGESQQQNEEKQSGDDEKQPQSPQSEELGDLDKPREQESPSSSETEPPQQQPPQDTRKFGGRPDNETKQPPMDAQTAAAMQKLRDVTEGDSPARLFEMLQGESEKQKPAGKDW